MLRVLLQWCTRKAWGLWRDGLAHHTRSLESIEQSTDGLRTSTAAGDEAALAYDEAALASDEAALASNKEPLADAFTSPGGQPGANNEVCSFLILY
jgi:hypothetical protein